MSTTDNGQDGRSGAKRRPGRPVEERPRQAAIEATLELMAEHGAGGVTTGAVAQKAGISKATMYRRWDSKDALIADAIGTLVDQEIVIPDTGTLEGDVRILLAEAVELYSAPRAAALMPELVAAVARTPELAAAFREGFLVRRRAALGKVLERAAARGELRDDVDREVCIDLFGGVIFYRLLVTGGPLDARLVDELTAVVVRAIANN
jgi:AcrR family transcriptional regulator